MQFQQEELKLPILKQKNNLETWTKNLEIALWQKTKKVEVMQQELLAELLNDYEIIKRLFKRLLEESSGKNKN